MFFAPINNTHFSAAVLAQDDQVGEGMVEDGTKCGEGKVRYTITFVDTTCLVVYAV